MHYTRIFSALRLKDYTASILLLGPRQVGKTTLISDEFQLKKELWLQSPYQTKTLMLYNLMLEDEFLRLTTNPSTFRKEILLWLSTLPEGAPSKTIIVDEIQRVPALFNECQVLLDSLVDGMNKIRLILTGSSTRKLKRGGANLLPGRILIKNLCPLTLKEMRISGQPLPSIEEILTFGSLPGILSHPNIVERGALLKSYVITYIKEEIQAEAIVRNLGGFHRFLGVAALYSGQILNMSSISRDAGIPLPTIRKYFEILEDTFLATMIPCYSQKKELKKLYSHPKFYFFDIGIRNVLLERELRYKSLEAEKGLLFEHLIALELLKYKVYLEHDFQLSYFRTYGGLEVDFIIETTESWIAIEVKAKKNISREECSPLKQIEAYLPINKEKFKFLLCLMETPSYLEDGGIEVCHFVEGLNKIYHLLIQKVAT